MASVYDFEATAIDGTPVRLDAYRGRTLLIVNVASECGFTPQYAGLERLYRAHKDEGFVVLGFPCDQFGRQEPGTNAEIQQFCEREYDVTFPLFSKIKVNGPDAHPLFVYLKSQKKGLLGSEAIKWNFTKFLVDTDGRVLRRYGSADTPERIEKDLEGSTSSTSSTSSAGS
ncbi:MAG TPA: glutathione peroxidase [Vicinamibacterales bacterium]|nr:glutathione peroxidase [Vicinamibacterales bacterium]